MSYYDELGEIVRLDGDEHKSVSTGENILQTNHVISVMYDPENNN